MRAPKAQGNGQEDRAAWWLVFNPYQPGAPKVRHSNFASAQFEACRLAHLEGVKVHVLKVVGTAHPPVKPLVRWEERQ